MKECGADFRPPGEGERLCQHHIRRGSDISIFSSPVTPIGVLRVCWFLCSPGFPRVRGPCFGSRLLRLGRPFGAPLAWAASGCGSVGGRFGSRLFVPPCRVFGVDTGSIGILLCYDSA